MGLYINSEAGNASISWNPDVTLSHDHTLIIHYIVWSEQKQNMQYNDQRIYTDAW